MKRAVVDTNVAVVANGRNGNYHPQCRLACIDALEVMKSRGQTVIDRDRLILEEYMHNLREIGQPGVGDAFLKFILTNQNNSHRVKIVDLSANSFPDDPDLVAFDVSDRKFAAAARVARAPVLNAVDSDWWHHHRALARSGIEVRFLCGTDHFKPGNQP